MKVVLDCFGGDNCPQAPIEGALNVIRKCADIHIVLCGDQNIISDYLSTKKYDSTRISILDAKEVISNEDVPTMAIRRKAESSMVKSLRAVANGEADAIVSSGSTGALLTGATLIIKRIDGITRASLACIVPTVSGGYATVVDGGANVDCNVDMLKEFAIMGDAFIKSMFGIETPRVALMNNGVEQEKGNELTKQTYKILKESKLNFTGNIEPREILFGDADVVVCDGFAGNAAIKAAEGMAKAIFALLKKSINEGGIKGKLGAVMLKPALRSVKHRLNSDSIGGAPFLGVKSVVVKAHGSSNVDAFENAIITTKQMVDGKLIDKIKEGLVINAN